MLKRETFPVANIYVPTARRRTLDLKRVDAIAHSMLTEGQQTPILVRADGARYRYYTCSNCATKGKTVCKGRSIPVSRIG